MPKPVRDALGAIPDGPDYRGFGPQSVCLCGNDTLAVAVRFHDDRISFYFLDGRCLECGSYLLVPTDEDSVACG